MQHPEKKNPTCLFRLLNNRHVVLLLPPLDWHVVSARYKSAVVKNQQMQHFILNVGHLHFTGKSILNGSNRNDSITIFLALSIHTLSEKPHFLCLIMIYRFAYHIFARQIACGNVIFTHFLLMLQSSFGFIDYYDRQSAALAILSLNGKQL